MKKSSPLSGNLLGIALMLMATVAGVGSAIIIKEMSAVTTLMVLLALRFLASMPILTIYAYSLRRRDMFKVNRWTRLIMRIIVGHIGITFWFLSVKYTSLGQATALFQSASIFATILAPFLLGEKIGIYRYSAVVVGLIGVVMITDPFGGVNIGTFYGIMSAISGAFLVILLRLLGRTEEPATVALWHNIAGIALYTPIMLILDDGGVFTKAAMTYLGFLCILGISSSFVQIGFTAAYRHGEAAVIAPIRYLSVPLAAIAGTVIWQETLSIMEVSGMVIIVLSCVFISLREYRQSRKAASEINLKPLA